MHQTQDIIHKERPDGQGAEDTWGGGGSSGHGRYAPEVKVVFADEHGREGVADDAKAKHRERSASERKG